MGPRPRANGKIGEAQQLRTAHRKTRADLSMGKQPTLVVESQLYMAGALVSFDAYAIGKLPNHKGR